MPQLWRNTCTGTAGSDLVIIPGRGMCLLLQCYSYECTPVQHATPIANFGLKLNFCCQSHRPYKRQVSPQFSKIDHAHLLTLIQVDIFLVLRRWELYCLVHHIMALCERLALRQQDQGSSLTRASLQKSYECGLCLIMYCLHLLLVLSALQIL